MSCQNRLLCSFASLALSIYGRIVPLTAKIWLFLFIVSLYIIQFEMYYHHVLNLYFSYLVALSYIRPFKKSTFFTLYEFSKNNRQKSIELKFSYAKPVSMSHATKIYKEKKRQIHLHKIYFFHSPLSCKLNYLHCVVIQLRNLTLRSSYLRKKPGLKFSSPSIQTGPYT